MRIEWWMTFVGRRSRWQGCVKDDEEDGEVVLEDEGMMERGASVTGAVATVLCQQKKCRSVSGINRIVVVAVYLTKDLHN